MLICQPSSTHVQSTDDSAAGVVDSPCEKEKPHEWANPYDVVIQAD